MRPDRAGGVITPPALFFYPRSALRILPKTYAERGGKIGQNHGFVDLCQKRKNSVAIPRALSYNIYIIF